MTSIAKNELHFNLACHEMAKSNLLLAYQYTIDLSPNFLSRYLPKPASASFALKDRCINLIKAPLLSLRALLLCVPIVNRVTQLALRFLSPRKLDEFVKSSPMHFRPKKKELEIRYSENIRREFIKNYLTDKIDNKQKFTPSDLDLFKNLGFSSQEVKTIFTELSPALSIDLINSPEFDKVRYSKNTRYKFLVDYLKDKINTGKIKRKMQNRLQITEKDLILSDAARNAFLKLGFKPEDYSDIALSFLKNNQNAILSRDLQQKITVDQKKTLS